MLPRLALEREPGRLAPGAREGRVTEATPAAGRRDEPGADPDQVGEYLAVGGLDLGPVRHRDNQVGGVGAGAVRALSRPAVAGPANRPAMEVEIGRAHV